MNGEPLVNGYFLNETILAHRVCFLRDQNFIYTFATRYL